jgi:glycosyltransferase involved in cell wall biosynthesis
MNILFLVSDINIKRKTGDSVHVRELALSLAKIGNEVSLVAPYTDNSSEELKPLINHDKIRIFFIKPNPHFRFFSTVSFCMKVVKDQDCNVIYERNFTPKVGYTLNKLSKIPFVVEINGLRDKEMDLQEAKRDFTLIPKNLRKRAWRHLFKNSGKIVVVSHGLKKGLSDEYGLEKEKIKVIYNGANTDLFKPMDIAQCKEELGFSQELRYVGFTGNLAPWQGVEQLIEIAPKVMDMVPKARFIIVGDGILRSQLEKSSEKLGIRDKIIFTGFVPYENVPKYINSFEVCVAPFSGIERNVKYSFSAIKLYEYMACGKPIVTTNVVGIKEEIRELGLGKVVKAGDLKDLTSRIIELMSDSKLQSDIGKRARAWVSKEHSWEKVAERVAGVCEDVLSAK